jgi:hypothetical protein
MEFCDSISFAAKNLLILKNNIILIFFLHSSDSRKYSEIFFWGGHRLLEANEEKFEGFS